MAAGSLQTQDFRVQIGAFGDSFSYTYFTERGVRNVITSVDQTGIYRYFVGSYNTREDAEAVQRDMIDKGFPYTTIIDLEEQKILCGANCPYFRDGMVYVKDPSQEMTVRSIFFDFGRYNLSAASKAELNKVADVLKENPDLKLKVLGFTDAVGSASANIQLATSRARVARNYIINKGVFADRIFIKVFGEASPAADNQDFGGNDMPDNRKWNRRVVLAIIDEKGEVQKGEDLKE